MLQMKESDFEILRLIYRFRFCLGRHIKELIGYKSLRASDRRLKAILEAGYIERKKYLFGIPYLYTLSHKGRMLLGVNHKKENIRIDRILHDIHVLDTVIYFVKKYNLALNNIISEKELYSLSGFTVRVHHPDFIIDYKEKKLAVEVELTPKNKEILEKNIKANFINYDSQTWISNNIKVLNLLAKLKDTYSNVVIINLGEVLDYIRDK